MSSTYQCPECGVNMVEKDWVGKSGKKSLSEFNMVDDYLVCDECGGEVYVEDLLHGPYVCPSCEAVSLASEWTQTSRTRAHEEAESVDEIPGDNWCMSSAEPGDTVWCPVCERDHERSEVKSV